MAGFAAAITIFMEERLMDYYQIKQITLASAIAVVCTLPVAATVDAEIYLKYDGVVGESTDSAHKDEIDVLSWSWGMSSDSKDKKGTCIEDLLLTKYVDSATPGFVQSAANRDQPVNAVLTVDRAGETTFVLEFSGIGVKEIHTHQADADDRPTEEVAFYYNKVDGTYQRPVDADGTTYDPQSFVVLPGKCKP